MSNWKVDVLIGLAILTVVCMYGVYVALKFGGF